jgi:hypothetical protein
LPIFVTRPGLFVAAFRQRNNNQDEDDYANGE